MIKSINGNKILYVEVKDTFDLKGFKIDKFKDEDFDTAIAYCNVETPIRSFTQVGFRNKDGSKALICLNALLGFDRDDIKSFNIFLSNDYKFTIFEAVTIGFECIYLKAKLTKVIPPSPYFLKKEWYWSVDLGNKHAIYFVDEFNKAFEKKHVDDTCYFNYHFVKIISNSLFEIKTYECGVGRTKSCGSGALASALVANRLGLIRSLYVEAKSEGGSHWITLEGNNLKIGLKK